jgi:hypothetical protein
VSTNSSPSTVNVDFAYTSFSYKTLEEEYLPR